MQSEIWYDKGSSRVRREAMRIEDELREGLAWQRVIEVGLLLGVVVIIVVAVCLVLGGLQWQSGLY